MSYYLDFGKLNLDFLKKRLLTEDLIPSQLPLREGLIEKLKALHQFGIITLLDLNTMLKKDASIFQLSKGTGIHPDYLKLLARVLRGYTPKSVMLSSFPNVNTKVINKLIQYGIEDTCSLWTAAAHLKNRAKLAAETGIPDSDICTLVCLSDLCRIQWVSPIFSRLIFEAGFITVRDVANAQAEDLMVGVSTSNKKLNLFKGKIGERDMARLVYLASLLPHELELKK